MTAMYWVAVALGGRCRCDGASFFSYSVTFRRGFSPAYVCSKCCWLRSHWCDLGVVFTDGRARCVECVPHDGRAGWLYKFSSFSLETVQLAQQGQWMTAGLYVVASVSLCVAAAGLGILSVRAFN